MTGLDGPDLQTSLATLSTMAEGLKASAWLLKYMPAPHGRRCALVHVKSNCVEDVAYTGARALGL